MEKRVVTSVIVGVAFLLMMIGQFVPTAAGEEDYSQQGQQFGGFQTPGFAAVITWEFGMWGATTDMNGNGDYTSWYDSDIEASDDGVAALRTAPIFLTVGLAALLAGAILLWIPATTRVATWVFVGAGVAMAVAAITHTVGIVQAYDGDDIGWSAGAFMLWIGAACAAAAAIMPGIQKIVEMNKAAPV